VSAEAGRLSDLSIDVEDYAALILTHRNGLRSEIHLDYLQRLKRRGCEIVGTEGTLIWTSEGKSPEHCLVRLRCPGERDWVTLLDDPDMDVAAPYAELMRLFLDRDADDRELLDSRGAAEDLAIALAARRAAAAGSTVRPELIR
jgi:predicted dehydrogenase